jgi:signal peptidase II
MTPRLRLGIIAAILALIVDQISKLWLLSIFDIARRGMVSIMPFMDFVLAWNTGISYGWLSGSSDAWQWALVAFKVVAVVALAAWMVRAQTYLATFSLGLIIGGAIGNGIDRAIYGAVVDFVLLHAEIGGRTYSWYVFNLADVAIVAGVLGLMYDSFRPLPAVKAP